MGIVELARIVELASNRCDTEIYLPKVLTGHLQLVDFFQNLK